MVVTGNVAQANYLPVDSVGVVTQQGARFIKHQVVAKENIYSVSRKYQVPVGKITQANPGLKSLIVGQVILVPVIAAKQTAKITKNPTNSGLVRAGKTPVKIKTPVLFDEHGNGVHKVDTKQTLYSIANMYGVSMADIKKWNNLPDNNVHDNQTLIVKLNRQPQKLVSTPPAIEPVNPVKPESASVATAPAVVSRPETVQNPAHSGTPQPDTARTASNPRETFSRVTENGLAELIGNGVAGNKYLALHKTAPVGSFITVRNLMNNQTVSVRVIGKLPEIGSNEKVVVKISKRAFQRLGAIDNRFLVEVQYEVADKILSSNR